MGAGGQRDGADRARALLREYHDAVAGWRPGTGVVRADGSSGGEDAGTLVCHGDYGPWNLVWEGRRPVGIVDWEYAHVGSPLDGVAYALAYVAPFRSDLFT